MTPIISLLGTLVQVPVEMVQHVAADLKAWIEMQGLEHPRSSLLLFKLLRRHKPILVLGETVVVSKFDDILEALAHEDEFTVQLYVPKMAGLAGLSTLAMPDTPEFQRDITALSAAVRPDDLARVADYAAKAAAAYLNGAKIAGSINVVDMLQASLNRVVADYFGSPGPDNGTQYGWVQSLYNEIFVRIGQMPLQADAVEASKAWARHMMNLIALRKESIAAGSPVPDDLLGRLIQAQTDSKDFLSDEVITPNLMYMMVGFIPNVLRLAILAVDELLGRPDQLAGAAKAASANDDQLVQTYLFEALRFNPPAPALMRKTPDGKTYTLAAGTPRQTTVPGGSVVVLALESAMQDEDKLDNPQEFRLNRPREHYLYFGSGVHECLGRHVGTTVLVAALKPLLQLQNLARAADGGQIAWDGAFPEGLQVTTGP